MKLRLLIENNNTSHPTLQYFDERINYWRNVPTINKRQIEYAEDFDNGEYPEDFDDLYKE